MAGAGPGPGLNPGLLRPSEAAQWQRALPIVDVTRRGSQSRAGNGGPAPLRADWPGRGGGAAVRSWRGPAIGWRR
ncbi:hypothetical protein NDU88_008392 [Pleurodeles waltl]|uniref:Uncharacterized protein n=1 Tax=Pleurodeles waltl TaxID=8319 RepID=A0AAV7N751_PLEWA|nr:hypothetical protein NDU88_008392 [Pleurodeles waltl]